MSRSQAELTDLDGFGSVDEAAGPNRPDGSERRKKELEDATPEAPFEFLDAPLSGVANERFDSENGEWGCTGCGNRVTVSPDGQRVYGCAASCEHTRARCGEVLG